MVLPGCSIIHACSSKDTWQWICDMTATMPHPYLVTAIMPHPHVGGVGHPHVDVAWQLPHLHVGGGHGSCHTRGWGMAVCLTYTHVA